MQPGKSSRPFRRTIGRGFENVSGLGFWTSHPLHHAHMVIRQSHVRPESCEARDRRARAKNRTRKVGNHEPTASQMVFVGTRFSIGQLSDSIFPAAFVVRWKKRVPTGFDSQTRGTRENRRTLC